MHNHILQIQLFAIAGLQAEESIHHSSESHGVHTQPEISTTGSVDDLRQEVWSDYHAL